MDYTQSLQGQRAAFVWFTESQLQSVIRNGVVPEWFHGIISRKMAEELLMCKPRGYFLIRVSESRIGYTLSYRAEDRCRHFMIDALEDGHYVIVGESRRHRFLQDLVNFHRRTPIIPFNEVLTVACGQTSSDKTDYAELLFPQRNPNHKTSLQPKNLPPPSTSEPVAKEDIPPALPYRPDNLCPNSQTNRLYPNLEEEYPHVTSPHPATPVAMTRNSYTEDNPPSSQPPDVPARSAAPQLKQNQACPRTVSAPESLSTATEHPFGANIQSVKNQEAKPSVVTNIRNFKKKFQKRPSMSQEVMYTEINVVATHKSGNTDSDYKSGNTDCEYQEITGERTFNRPQSSCTDVTDGGLPKEYLQPPPFAPGY